MDVLDKLFPASSARLKIMIAEIGYLAAQKRDPGGHLRGRLASDAVSND
jgi:hypothetical protein